MSYSKICFVLPGSVRNVPIGGVKVVYEYANRFVQDGFDVCIAYITDFPLKNDASSNNIWAIVKYLLKHILGYSGKRWFNLDERIKEVCIPKCNSIFLPTANLYVATSVSSAMGLNKVNRGKKVYFIQGYEIWEVDESILHETYRYSMPKIVISNELKSKVEDAGGKATFIPNSFDFDKFNYNLPCENRNKFSVCMLYHLKENKGCKYGLEAIEIVKKKYPNLKVTLFGTPERPKWLPLEYEYYCRPDNTTHNRINNESAIFLSPSLTEGCGLTVGEAMICGEAVVCTDIGGHREIANNNYNALFCPVKNPKEMANCILKLIEDDNLRIRLAKCGEQSIHRFSWDNSYQEFKKILLAEL